jgi:hypothetical protein
MLNRIVTGDDAWVYHFNANHPGNGSILVELQQKSLNVCNQQARLCWLIIGIKKAAMCTGLGTHDYL